MKYSTLMYYLASQRLQSYFNLMLTEYKPKFNFITGLGYQKPRMKHA